MEKVYTLRIAVQLFDQESRGDWVENVLQVRTQELTGDLSELQLMDGAIARIADGMAMAVLGAERRRQLVTE